MTTETTPTEIKAEKKEKPEIKDQLVITRHTITLSGEDLN